MTREDILAMTAGKELDDLVTVHVMEWLGIWKPFFPSTDISAAWEVVEKLPQVVQCHMSVETIWPYKTMEYRVTVLTINWSRKYEVVSQTAPEAICKAALLTVLEGQAHDL